jgi:UDP-glucose:tetrahydrobiopterin glucosyltransferase
VRVALVAPLVSAIAEPHVGGAQALLDDLARELVQRGHQVTLFARAGSFVPGVYIEPIAVPDSVHPANFSKLLRESTAMKELPAIKEYPTINRGATDAGFFAQANLFLELFLQLRRRNAEFDLIHAHAFDWPAFACSALVHAIPVLHTIHLPALSVEINSALRVLHQQGHPLTLITVSHACARTYADFTSIDHVIYNGLDLGNIPFAPVVPAEAPLLFAGRIAPEKGVEAAIEIAKRAGRRLLIAGGIYDRDYYVERIVPQLQRADEQVTYVGLLERRALWEMMGRSLGLLFPIQWDEPFGLTAVEAMATGTPVIAFRRGAAVEVIRDGETGFLVEPGDRSQAAALVDKLKDISRRQCRVHVEAHFAIGKMIDAYEEVYREQV